MNILNKHHNTVSFLAPVESERTAALDPDEAKRKTEREREGNKSWSRVYCLGAREGLKYKIMAPVYRVTVEVYTRAIRALLKTGEKSEWRQRKRERGVI